MSVEAFHTPATLIQLYPQFHLHITQKPVSLQSLKRGV
jgi:hypothetical protein